ncbi:unnamed protein product [Rhizopus stolonifer]
MIYSDDTLAASLYSRDNTSSESLVSRKKNSLCQIISGDTLIIRENPPSIEASEQDILLDASIHLKMKSAFSDELLQQKEHDGEDDHLLYLASKQGSQDLCIDRLFPETTMRSDEPADRETETPYITPYIDNYNSPMTTMSEIIDEFPPPLSDHSRMAQSSTEAAQRLTYTGSRRSSALSSGSENASYESAVEDYQQLEDDCLKKKPSAFSGFKNKLKKMCSKPKPKETGSSEPVKLTMDSKKSTHDTVKETILTSINMEGQPSLPNSVKEERSDLIKGQGTPETPSYNRFAKYKQETETVYTKPENGTTNEYFDDFTSKLFEGFDVDVSSF